MIGCRSDLVMCHLLNSCAVSWSEGPRTLNFSSMSPRLCGDNKTQRNPVGAQRPLLQNWPRRWLITQPKQAFEGVEQAVRGALGGFVAERFERRVQQFVH